MAAPLPPTPIVLCMMPESGHHISDSRGHTGVLGIWKAVKFCAILQQRKTEIPLSLDFPTHAHHVQFTHSQPESSLFNFKRNSLKLTIIGDTHMRHDELGVMRGDVLIHVGDMFDLFNRNPEDLAKVDQWYARQHFDLILCIAGNHDLELENREHTNDQPFENAVYLEDTAFEHKGVNFYGTPWVPDLQTHAFYADEPTLQDKWSLIPNETDVLITHTPPAGILDRSSQGMSPGCPHLTDAVTGIAPKIHCFGHVHASGGSLKCHGINFINASCYNQHDGRLRRPVHVRVTTD